MSEDGSRLIIGSPFNGFNNEGNIRIYDFNNTFNFFILTAEIFGQINEERFGWSVSMSADGTKFIVGSPGSGEPNSIGRIRIFHFINGVWQLISVFTENLNASPQSQFGWSVAISDQGNKSIGGAPYVNTKESEGYVDIYSNFDILSIKKDSIELGLKLLD